MLGRLQAIGRGALGQSRGSNAVQEQHVGARHVSSADSVLLLVPSGGGMAYQLFAVESEAAAAAFVQQQFPALADKSITFRPRAAQPAKYAGDNGEALVLVADSERPGMVYVSSFEEMEAAQSFLRFEEENGMDMDLVTTYWGVPQPVLGIRKAHSEQGAVEPVTVGKVQPARVATPVHYGTGVPVKPAAGVRVNAAASASEAVAEQKNAIVEAIRSWPGWATLRARLIAASVLNREVYEPIRKDPIAWSQARVIVAAAAAVTGIGAFWFGPVAVITYTLLALGAWLACAYLTYWVGTTLFTGRRSDESKEWLFKSLAFAQGPRLLLLAGVLLPGFSVLLALAMFIWTLAASVPAVEESLELDRESALLSALTGWMAMYALAEAVPLLIL